jgi:hypothetical protein
MLPDSACDGDGVADGDEDDAHDDEMKMVDSVWRGRMRAWMIG